MLFWRGVLYLLTSVLCFQSSGAQAQIKNCNGIWTDRNCTGSIGKTIEEIPNKAPPTKAEKLAEGKRAVLLELVSTSYSARKEHDIYFSHKFIEKQCTPTEISLEECRKIVGEAHERLLAMIDRAIISKQEKAEATVTPTYNTNITITQPDYLYLPPPIYRPGREGTHRPGPFQGYRSRWK